MPFPLPPNAPVKPSAITMPAGPCLFSPARKSVWVCNTASCWAESALLRRGSAWNTAAPKCNQICVCVCVWPELTQPLNLSPPCPGLPRYQQSSLAQPWALTASVARQQGNRWPHLPGTWSGQPGCPSRGEPLAGSQGTSHEPGYCGCRAWAHLYIVMRRL